MENVLRWYEQAAKLKELKRIGWQHYGVEPGESVADHSLGVALLALVVPRAAGLSVNVDRVVTLAVVHDLAEAIVGDITPMDAISPDEKHRREADAMRQLEDLLGDGSISALWDEFELGQTEEAKLARELDMIEMAWQAKSYQRRGAIDLSEAMEFIETAMQRVRSDAGVRLLKLIVEWE